MPAVPPAAGRGVGRCRWRLAAPLLAAVATAAEPGPLPGLAGVEAALEPVLAVGVATASRHGLHADAAAIGGLRALLAPGPSTRLGVEASWLGLGGDVAAGLPRSWLLGGLVVEQTVAERFRLAAGSLAAIGTAAGSADAPDLMLEMAWLPPLAIAGAAPAIAYRSDLLLSSPALSVRSLALGLAWRW